MIRKSDQHFSIRRPRRSLGSSSFRGRAYERVQHDQNLDLKAQLVEKLLQLGASDEVVAKIVPDWQPMTPRRGTLKKPGIVLGRELTQ